MDTRKPLSKRSRSSQRKRSSPAVASGDDQFWTTDPIFLALAKRLNSKGAFQGDSDAEHILFIPSAVLLYGFAHIPTRDDPQGRLFSRLPAVPEDAFLKMGYYIYTTEVAEGASFEDQPEVSLATRIYRESGRIGHDPQLVHATLRRQLEPERFLLELDASLDLDKQFKEFRAWARRLGGRRYGQRTASFRPKREAARDTLIYTFKNALGCSVKEIAQRVFHRDPTDREFASLEQRVRTSLSRTEKALTRAGLPHAPVARPRVSRGRKPRPKSSALDLAASRAWTIPALLELIRDRSGSANVT
jgi:hypothetical protein